VKGGGTLASVWNGAGYRRYRREIRETQKKEVMCRRCPELLHQEMDPGLVFTATAPPAAPAAAEAPALAEAS
jgi:hypothetical protein